MANRIELVLGPGGCGKTTLVKRALSRMPHAWVWDPMGEYGDVATRTWDDLSVFANAVGDGTALSRVECFQLPANQFESLCALACKAGEGHRGTSRGLTLVLEELDQVCSASHAAEFLREVIRRGRNLRIDFIGVSKRPADIPKDLLAQAHTLNLYGMTELRDLEYLERRLSKDVADQVRALGGKVGAFVRHHVRT